MTLSGRYSKLSIEFHESVAVISLDNPPVNSLNSLLTEELAQAVADVDRSASKGDVRTLILTAEGDHFCAGADLKERAGMSEGEVKSAVGRIRSAVEAVWNVRVPVLAAV